jgi:DNA-cytosine methyltransferase
MNVLSLFDGMSCGQIALNRLGIKYDNYYAAEIDKYAIEVTKKNYPNTIHLGDVTKVKVTDLEPIDLLMGGSPCQGFSFAGKQLNFDDPRSALFFEFVRLLKECKPKYFLLENVRMKKIYQDVITEHLGVEPIMINSSLLSAQNRLRLYWTNIPNITIPEDKGLVLKDILEYNQTSVSELSEAKKDRVLNSQRGKGFFYNPDQHDKIGTLIAGYHKEPTDASYLEIPIKNPERVRETSNYWQMDVSGKGYASQQDRIRKLDKPSNSLAAGSASIPKVMLHEKVTYRKLTPIECERLQTVPDNYTQGVSNTQRYKMLGNGWTVDVIAHILKNINEENNNTLQTQRTATTDSSGYETI